MLIKFPSVTERSAIAGNVGFAFTSVAVSWKVFVALNVGDPLSETITVTVVADGACASVGVHVNTPAAVSDAPAGAPCIA